MGGTVFVSEFVAITPDRVYIIFMSIIGSFIKEQRKKEGITQKKFAMRSGLGLRFVRDTFAGTVKETEDGDLHPKMRKFCL